MKRIICLFLSLVMVLPYLTFSSVAAEATTDIIYLDDGSYITIVTTERTARASGTKTASRTYSYTESDGDVSWKAVLQGTFTYNGTSATCTASSCTVTIYDTAWYQVSKTTEKNGAVARAELTMGYKFLGVTVKKVPLSMTLTCDANGNLS